MYHVFADSFNDSGVIDTDTGVLWFAQSAPHHAREQHAAHKMSIERIERRGAHPNEHLSVIRFWLFDVFDLKNIRRAVITFENGLDRIGGNAAVALAIIGRRPVGDKAPKD